MEKRVGWAYPGRLTGACVTMCGRSARASASFGAAGGCRAPSKVMGERERLRCRWMAVGAFLPTLSAAQRSTRAATVPPPRVSAWPRRASSMVLGRGEPGWPRPLSWGCLASPRAGRALTIQAVERFEHRARTNGKASPSSGASVVGLSRTRCVKVRASPTHRQDQPFDFQQEVGWCGQEDSNLHPSRD